MNIAFHTLGCKLNFSETSFIANDLKNNGFNEVEFNEVSDIYVINTCTVTENANKECKYLVRKVLRKNKEARVIVMGCYAQLKPKEIQKINQLKELGSVGVLDPYGIYKNPLTDKPFSPKYRELAIGIGDKKGWHTQLTYEQRFDFFRMLVKNQVVLVIAGTGVGKTVIIPKLMSHYFGYEKAIVVTIPTRKLVISAAGFAALCRMLKMVRK